jgi:hypothetical protein
MGGDWGSGRTRQTRVEWKDGSEVRGCGFLAVAFCWMEEVGGGVCVWSVLLSALFPFYHC